MQWRQSPTICSLLSSPPVPYPALSRRYWCFLNMAGVFVEPPIAPALELHALVQQEARDTPADDSLPLSETAIKVKENTCCNVIKNTCCDIFENTC